MGRQGCAGWCDPGGRAQGADWRARVLPGGGDFQLIVSETLSNLDARYGLETEAGELVYVQNHAVRRAPADAMAALLRGEAVDPAAVYFRCMPRFETTAPSLGWIGEKLFVGVGVRHPDRLRCASSRWPDFLLDGDTMNHLHAAASPF